MIDIKQNYNKAYKWAVNYGEGEKRTITKRFKNTKLVI